MTSRLLTPAMAGLLERIRRADRPAIHALDPPAARAAYEAGAEILDLPRAALPRVETLEIAGRPARLYAAGTGRLPPLLYLHGGGGVVGSLETHDSLCRQLALRSGGAVVALDYRLAPEHPFPAAVGDCWAALEGLADTPSHRLFGQGFLLDAATMAWFSDHCLPYHHRRDWRYAPLEAPDLDGVAPACIVLAECDPLVDEGLAYADRLRLAGVPVQLELARGVTHDFIKMGRALKEASACQQAAAEALKVAWT